MDEGGKLPWPEYLSVPPIGKLPRVQDKLGHWFRVFFRLPLRPLLGYTTVVLII